MKYLITIFITFLCTASSFAQADKKLDFKDLLGKWTGYYEQNGIQKDLTFVFTDSTCTVDIPDQQVKFDAAEVRFCQAGDFHVSQAGIGQGFSFAGTPRGNSIEGHYKIGNVCERKPPAFKLQRVAAR